MDACIVLWLRNGANGRPDLNDHNSLCSRAGCSLYNRWQCIRCQYWCADRIYSVYQPFLGTDQYDRKLYNSVVTAVSYLERIFETIDEPVEVKDAKDAIEMPAIQGKLEFEHVTFSYEKGVEILKDVNFSVEPGKTIAFVGPTEREKARSSI